jgi:hypothetical protein
MKVEQVKLLRTLKSGSNVWIEGSYFPNKEYPSIPHVILEEVRLRTGRVEVTQQSEDVVLPEKSQTQPDLTSTSVDVATKVTSRASLEESRHEEKRKIEAAELPKRKSKLVRR